MGRPSSSRSSQSQVQFSVVGDFCHLASRRDEWNALVQQCPTATVFQTFEWLSSWWMAFGYSGQCLIVLAERQGELLGIAPLMLVDRPVLGFLRRVVQFIGTGHCDYQDVIYAPGEETVLGGMCTHLSSLGIDWDIILLTDIPAMSQTLRFWPAAMRSTGVPWFARLMLTAPVFRIGDAEEDRRVLGLRTPRRYENYYRRNGHLALHVAEPQEARARLAQFFEQHISRWRDTDTPSQYRDSSERELLLQAADAMVPKGWMRISALQYDQSPIALDIGLDYKNKILYYRGSYDIRYARRGPGKVIRRLLIKDAIERGRDEYDLGVGDEGYKYAYANDSHETFELRAYRRLSACTIDRFLLRWRDRAMPVFRESRILRRVGLMLLRLRPDLLR